VGDRERDAAADALGSAYVRGYLTHEELSGRLGEALAARSTGELGASVRGLPDRRWFLLSSAFHPFLAAGRERLRRRAGAILRRLALAFVAVTSAVVLLGLGLWTLADGLSGQVALGFLIVWLALNGPPLLIWRSARRLLR
jgi:hypothetical protein